MTFLSSKYGGGSGHPAFKGALVSQTAVTSIPDAISTDIEFDTEKYDTSDFHTSGDNTRLTIPQGVSKVRLTGNIDYVNTAVGKRALLIVKNGGDSFVGGPAVDVDSTSEGITHTKINIVTPVLEVEEGDYFCLQVWQNSGGAIDTRSNYTWFSIEVVE